MQFSIYTGQTADLLQTTEPVLNDLIRRRKVHPPPRVVAGRRQWEESHILQAAELLGVPTDDLRRRLGEEVAHVP